MALSSKIIVSLTKAVIYLTKKYLCELVKEQLLLLMKLEYKKIPGSEITKGNIQLTITTKRMYETIEILKGLKISECSYKV